MAAIVWAIESMRSFRDSQDLASFTILKSLKALKAETAPPYPDYRRSSSKEITTISASKILNLSLAKVFIPRPKSLRNNSSANIVVKTKFNIWNICSCSIGGSGYLSIPRVMVLMMIDIMIKV